MKFYYKCGAANGKVTEDYIEAANIKSAKDILEGKGFVVFEIKKVNAEISFMKGKGKKEIIPFTKMFHVLIKSGMEIINILDTLHEQVEDKGFKDSITQIIRDVRSGQTMANSMKKHKYYFSDFYCSAVEAGEKSGTLTLTFNRLHAHLKSSERIKARVQLALIYPTVLTVFAVLVVLFLSLFVLPSFAKIYSSFGKELPMITKVVLGMSEFIKSFWYLIIGGIVGAIFALKNAMKKPAFKESFDGMLLKMGMLSDFIYRKEITAIFRTLSLSISSGMDIIKALKIARETTGNIVIKKSFDKVVDMVTHGEKLSKSLKEIQMPKMAVQMINAGEESNNLEEMLDNVSEFYEEEIDNLISGLMGAIEPILIIVVGGIVGIIIIAMILPILTLSTALS